MITDPNTLNVIISYVPPLCLPPFFITYHLNFNKIFKYDAQLHNLFPEQLLLFQYFPNIILTGLHVTIKDYSCEHNLLIKSFINDYDITSITLCNFHNHNLVMSIFCSLINYKLKQLYLNNCFFKRAIIQSFPNLQHVKILHSNDGLAATFAQLSECSNLEHLIIDNSKIGSNNTFQHKKLRILEISNPYDKTFHAEIFQNCENLKQLKLIGCKNITNLHLLKKLYNVQRNNNIEVYKKMKNNKH